MYDAKFANGRAKIRISLGPDGKFDDANVQVENEGTPGGIVACSDEPTLKSRTSTSLPIMMTIVNGTGGVINLFDLSPSGDRYSTWILPMPPIADGRSMPRMAATTQPLVVTDKEGNDSIAIRSVVHLTLGYDHRLIDGAVADQFMALVKKNLETWNEEIG